MKISVIIPTFNRRDVLARSLPLLLDQDFSEGDYEVIVVVDGSTDGTAEMARSMGAPRRLKVIEQDHRGAAVARNTAVSASSADLLLFLDDDILCSRTLMGEHFAAHHERGPIVSHGPIYVAPESPPTLVAHSTRLWYNNHYKKFTPEMSLDVYRQGFLISNTCMPRDLLLVCGGFDPDMFLLEDTELGIRLSKSGVRFTYLPLAAVQEFFSKPTSTFINHDAARQGKAEIILCRKHPDYRPFSALSNLGGGTLTRRLLRKLVLSSPIRFEKILDLPLWVLERLLRFEGCRRAGLYLLGVCHRLAFLRSAVQEAGSYRALILQFGVRLPVLLYHNVGRVLETGFSGLTIAPDRFERQMRWLAARGYAAIRASDWIAWAIRGVPLPPKPVLLTCDDGYADLVAFAFPVLRQLGYTAEVFVVSRFLGETNAWDHGGQIGSHALMTPRDIKSWSMNGICFGAHTRTHPNLNSLPETAIQFEIEGSSEDLAEILGKAPLAFAYPYGYNNATIKDVARRFFQCAFSVDEGFNTLSTDLFSLKRLWIPHDRSLLDFACRVCLGWSPVSELRSFLRIRSRAKWIMGAMTLSR
jgi:GT2 family glycosyltransferase/peptidoglycan/xylan/chitin deacetylase (PgdA/CDA1 family)